MNQPEHPDDVSDPETKTDQRTPATQRQERFLRGMLGCSSMSRSSLCSSSTGTGS